MVSVYRSGGKDLSIVARLGVEADTKRLSIAAFTMRAKAFAGQG